MKSLKRVANALLALVAGILFPLIIWIMLAVSLRELFQEWMLRHAPARTIGDLLKAAGLSIDWQATEAPMPVMVTCIFPLLSVSEVRQLLARAGL